MNLLQKKRQLAGMTQLEVAERVIQPGGMKGVSKSYVSNAEQGYDIPDWFAKELARVLGCKYVGTIFEGYVKKKRWVSK